MDANDLYVKYPWLHYSGYDMLKGIPDGWKSLCEDACCEINNEIIKDGIEALYTPLSINIVLSSLRWVSVGGNFATRMIEDQYEFASTLYCPICGKFGTKYKILTGDLKHLYVCDSCAKILSSESGIKVQRLTWGDIPSQIRHDTNGNILREIPRRKEFFMMWEQPTEKAEAK